LSYGIYLFFGWIVCAAGLPLYLLYNGIVVRKWNRFGQRFGLVAARSAGNEGEPHVWLHGASVGEVQLARPLIAELRKRIPEVRLTLSTMTPQGLQVAEKYLGKDVQCIYAPLDLAGVVDHVLAKLKPTVYVCLETELWPAMLRAVRKSGARLVLLNGRLSDKSYKRYFLVRGFMKRVLANFSRISVIQQLDADRLRHPSLGRNGVYFPRKPIRPHSKRTAF